ncbi:MAG TPA: dTDP-glucose 4,6-dehydratase [Acidimicrobiales bacterium]|nr:dTDP-glucose 4,6-dehydratase [Acidimicrobiales bacterium]
MNLLVTGGAGFIGANFTRWWIDRHEGDRIVVLDALTYAGNPANLDGIDGDVRLVEGDIADTGLVESLLRDDEIDVVVNFAAESHNSLAILDPRRFFQTNVMGTLGLLEGCRRAGIGRFHHISTCEVYGDLPLDADTAFTEQSPYNPLAPYNASKAGGDHAVRAYHHAYGLPVTITNCANNYGPLQFPEKVMPLFITRALNDEELPVYESSQNTREWIHVDDHCAAIAAVLDRGRVGETYFVGTGEERSVMQVADTVLAALGKPESLKKTVADRPGHERRYLLDSTKLRTELGWSPTITWEMGIPATVEWYADNRDWWEPLLERAPVVEDAWDEVRT